jgi:hypothetical protein
MALVPVLHALATFMLTGLIWFVQRVHYPLFPLVGERAFSRGHRDHVHRFAWTVEPLMIMEGLTILISVSRCAIAVPPRESTAD